jgi:hypothetical protein
MLNLQGKNMNKNLMVRHAESTRPYVGCTSQQAPPNSSPNFFGIVMTSMGKTQAV